MAEQKITIGTVAEARRVGRGLGDVARSKLTERHLFQKATRNIIAYEVEKVAEGQCCPDAQAGHTCRHAYTLRAMKGAKIEYASEDLQKLANLESQIVTAGGWRAAPQDLKNEAGQLAARLDGRPFVDFGDLGDFRAPGMRVVAPF
jgi:Ni,Fe-hydrogenase I large subunit